LTTEIIDDALDSVEIVEVVVIVTIRPDRLKVWPNTEILRVPSAEASAVIMGTEPSTRLLPLKDAFCTMVLI
jgi:hypothetical protein